MITRFLIPLLFALPICAQPLSPLDAPFTQNCSPLLPGLIGYWNLGEISGTRNDQSRTGAHFIGTNGVGHFLGIAGTCASFVASTGEWLVTKDTNLFNFTSAQSFSFMAWVKLTNNSKAQVIMSKLNIASPTRGYELYAGSSGRMTFSMDTDITHYLIMTGTTSITNEAWHFVGVTYNGSSSSNGVSIYVDGALETITSSTQTGAITLLQNNEFFRIGRENSTTAYYVNGLIDEVCVWNRPLSASEVARLCFPTGKATTFPLLSPYATYLDIDSPSMYQVIQRSGTTSDIAITGITSGTHSLEAQFNGGSWVQITTNSSGSFSGTLTAQSQGQGPLIVRWKDMPAVASVVNYVGIGDVFVIAGQSNAVGNGDNFQSYSGPLKAGLFLANYTWDDCTDPTARSYGAIDTVSSNIVSYLYMGGSIWPHLATHYMTNQPCPIAFIPCALDGSAIQSWLYNTSNTNRASLYGSMIWRSKYAIPGGVKSVLWWQGEADASNNVSRATYFQKFTNLSYNIRHDLGVQIMPCKFENESANTTAQKSNIWAATGDAWSLDTNTIAGPDLSDIPSDDSDPWHDHIRTDASLETCAERWWNALKAAFYP